MKSKQIKIIYLLTIMCVLISCKTSNVIDSIDISALEKSDSLFGSPISYIADGFESSVYVYNDSLIIVFNNADGTKCNDIIEVFNFKNMTPTMSYLEFGNEDGKFFYVLPYWSKDKLLLNDIVKKQIMVTNLSHNSDFIVDSSSPHQITFSVQGMTWYKDRLVLLNPCYFEDGKGGSNNQPRLVTTDISLQWTAPNVKYFSSNVTQGSLLAESQKNKIAFFDKNSSLMEIYSEDFSQPIKTVTGPDSSTPEYFILDAEAGTKTVLVSKEATSHYIDAVSDGNKIYAAYRNGSDNENDYLFCFDWDGDFIKSYKLNCKVKNLSLSANGKAIYVWQDTSVDKSSAKLLRYNL